jgi:hypothetical protein
MITDTAIILDIIRILEPIHNANHNGHMVRMLLFPERATQYLIDNRRFM